MTNGQLLLRLLLAAFVGVVAGVLVGGLTGCAKEKDTQYETKYSTLPAGEVTPQDVIDIENDYRSSVGQAPLTSGLTCNLYTVPNNTTQIVGASLTNVGAFTYTGQFNQPNASTNVGLNVLPLGLQLVYTQWFMLRCTGTLAITDNTWHSFEVISDDGTNLYIDGGLLINNDGLHGEQSKSASKYLKRGIHSIQLDYLQANGNQSLTLKMDSSVMSSSGLFH